jgi:hypothetical protein
MQKKRYEDGDGNEPQLMGHARTELGQGIKTVRAERRMSMRCCSSTLGCRYEKDKRLDVDVARRESVSDSTSTSRTTFTLCYEMIVVAVMYHIGGNEFNVAQLTS